MTEEVERLQKDTAVLYETAGLMEDRLGPVLAPEPPRPAAQEDEDAVQEAKSPLAESLWSLHMLLLRTTQRLDAIIRRLEV